MALVGVETGTHVCTPEVAAVAALLCSLLGLSGLCRGSGSELGLRLVGNLDQVELATEVGRLFLEGGIEVSLGNLRSSVVDVVPGVILVLSPTSSGAKSPASKPACQAASTITSSLATILLAISSSISSTSRSRL